MNMHLVMEMYWLLFIMLLFFLIIPTWFGWISDDKHCAIQHGTLPGGFITTAIFYSCKSIGKFIETNQLAVKFKM